MSAWNVNAIVRPHILTLTPYSSARDEYSGEKGIFLDANENPFKSAGGGKYNRYPDPLQQQLKSQLTIIKPWLQPQQIFIGNGSDEAIDLLIRAFCEPGKDHILIMPPTYGMYAVSASINAVEVKSVPLTPHFQINLPEVEHELSTYTKLIFVCSPNNPTGNALREEDIIYLLDTHQHGLIVVDEAYIDFSTTTGMVPLLEAYPNLVVMQTFSKAWGLAGLRLGTAYAHPDVINILNRIKPPYNVNSYTQQKALDALKDYSKVQNMIQIIISERERVAQQLQDISMVEKVFPSQSNFLLVRVQEADQVYQDLLQKWVIVRNRSKVELCENCLRFTIGTPDENDLLLESLHTLDPNYS